MVTQNEVFEKFKGTGTPDQDTKWSKDQCLKNWVWRWRVYFK